MTKKEEKIIKFLVFLIFAMAVGTAIYATMEITYSLRYAVDYKRSAVALVNKFGENLSEVVAVMGNMNNETPVTFFESFISNWLSLTASIALGLVLTWVTRWDKRFSNDIINQLNKNREGGK